MSEHDRNLRAEGRGRHWVDGRPNNGTYGGKRWTSGLAQRYSDADAAMRCFCSRCRFGPDHKIPEASQLVRTREKRKLRKTLAPDADD